MPFSPPFCFYKHNLCSVDVSNECPSCDFKYHISNVWKMNPNHPIYSFLRSIFLLSCQFSDNNLFFPPFFCLCRLLICQITAANWTLTSAPCAKLKSRFLLLSFAHGPTRFGTFPICVSNELRAVPLVILQRRPSTHLPPEVLWGAATTEMMC